MSPTIAGSGQQVGHNYPGTNSHSSSITNGSAVPSSQSVQQLSNVVGSQMNNGSGVGTTQISAKAMSCVAHSQSAHQLGLHQQLQQRFAAAAAASTNSYGNYNWLKCIMSNQLSTVKSKGRPYIASVSPAMRMPRE